MLKRWQLWLGLIISAVFLWLALRGLKLDEVIADMRVANYVWLLPGIAVHVMHNAAMLLAARLPTLRDWLHLSESGDTLRIPPAVLLTAGAFLVLALAILAFTPSASTRDGDASASPFPNP